MPEFSCDQFEQISRHVQRQEITFSCLRDELIDHLCCDVEYEMQQGLSFAEAYKKVKHKIGPRRLKEIQQETLYTVDTRYRNMKNLMKFSGCAGTMVFGFAALFKIMHWPGAGILLTLGALTLSFVFMPSALGVLWKETHSRKRLFLFISAFLTGMFFIMSILFKVQHWPGTGIILTLAGISGVLFFIPALLIGRLREPEYKTRKPLYIIGAAGLIFYLAGFLFRIQHWPLATMLMMSGLFILFMIVFPWYTWITWKEDNYVRAEFIFLVVGSMALVVPSAMVSLNLQRSYEDGYYVCQDQQKAAFNYLYVNNQSYLSFYHDSSAYPLLEQLHTRTDELIKLVNIIRSDMIAESEGKPGLPAENPQMIRQKETGAEIRFELLSKPFHPVPVYSFLRPGTVSRMKLETAMADYRIYLSGLIPVTGMQKFEKLLDPSTFLPAQISEENRISLMSGLHSLSLLINSLLIIESQARKYIVKH